MSKGEIIEHIEDGRYRVSVKHGVDQIQGEIDRLSNRIADLAVEIPEAKLEKLEKEGQANQVRSAINSLIPLFQESPDEYRKEILQKQSALIRISGELKQIDLSVARLIAENLAANKRRNQLQAIPESREVEAWCGDFSLELEGEVGLVDINDEGRQGVLIQPGFDGGAAYTPARDGSLMPRGAQSAPQAFFNSAVLPGVQKWRPRYRLGTLTQVDGDIGTVTLDEATSSAQGLGINQKTVLKDIPIQYMDCNGAVFEKDDRVLVRWFQSGPQVVGFAESPRECGVAFLCITAYSYCSTSYNNLPFSARFFKINFQTYEIAFYSEVELFENTMLRDFGQYVYNREPHHGFVRNESCETSYGIYGDFGVISPDKGFQYFSSPVRGVFAPTKIAGNQGVGISLGLYEPGGNETTLVFFDLDTLSQTGVFTYPSGGDILLFEGVVANQNSIIVQTYRGGPLYYGLMAFDRDMNFMARHDYGGGAPAPISALAANNKYVFAIMPDFETRLFVHDAQTLSVVYSVVIPFGIYRMAATSSHVIVCARNSSGNLGDGRTEIYKIIEEPVFNLELKKTAYYLEFDDQELAPIA